MIENTSMYSVAEQYSIEPKNLDPKSGDAKDCDLLKAHLKELCDRYVKEFGGNDYAVLNATTGFTSQLPNNHCVHRE